MHDGRAIFKKSMFVFGRICTVLALLVTVVYLLWYTSYPIYHWLSRTPGLSLLFFDDAIILPLGVNAIVVTAIGLMNILFYRKELPMHDHFLSLMQMPLLVFGSGIVQDSIDKSYGDRFSVWSSFGFGTGQMTAQVVTVVYFAILALFAYLMIRNTVRYAKNSAGHIRLLRRSGEDDEEAAA